MQNRKKILKHFPAVSRVCKLVTQICSCSKSPVNGELFSWWAAQVSNIDYLLIIDFFFKSESLLLAKCRAGAPPSIYPTSNVSKTSSCLNFSLKIYTANYITKKYWRFTVYAGTSKFSLNQSCTHSIILLHSCKIKEKGKKLCQGFIKAEESSNEKFKCQGWGCLGAIALCPLCLCSMRQSLNYRITSVRARLTLFYHKAFRHHR